MNEEFEKAKKKLISLYKKLRIGSEELDTESHIKKLGIVTLIDYIESSIDIAISQKAVELFNEYKGNSEDNEKYAAKYETLLRKEEKEIREHIKIENQIKLYSEKLSETIEVLENKIITLKKKIAQLESEKINSKNIEELQKEIKYYKEQNYNLNKNEAKLKKEIKEKEKRIKYLQLAMASQSNGQPNQQKNLNTLVMKNKLNECKQRINEKIKKLSFCDSSKKMLLPSSNNSMMKDRLTDRLHIPHGNMSRLLKHSLFKGGINNRRASQKKNLSFNLRSNSKYKEEYFEMNISNSFRNISGIPINSNNNSTNENSNTKRNQNTKVNLRQLIFSKCVNDK